MKNKEMKAKVLNVTFKSCSIYGNNSYYVDLVDDSGFYYKMQTTPNAVCAYCINNHQHKELFNTVTYHQTASGKLFLDYIRLITPTSFKANYKGVEIKAIKTGKTSFSIKTKFGDELGYISKFKNTCVAFIRSNNGAQYEKIEAANLKELKQAIQNS